MSADPPAVFSGVSGCELPAKMSPRILAHIGRGESGRAACYSVNTMKDRPEQSDAYYLLLIESSPDIVTVLGADGTVRYASPAAQR